MPGNARGFSQGWLTFRLKIGLTFLGVILPMAGVLLYILQRETSTQIDAAIHEAVGKSRRNLQELEESWKEELSTLCKRFANSPRILGAFDAALEEGNPAVIAEAAAYETKLAALSGYLILFFDADGRIRCALADGQAAIKTEETRYPVQNLPQGKAALEYNLFKGQLYATHAGALELFTRRIGYILIGFPLREELVRDLAQRVGGHLVIAVGNSAAVSTPGIALSALREQMVAAAGVEGSRVVAYSGQTWAIFSEFLDPRNPAEGSMVYAIPLESTLAPFQRIRTTLILAALGAIIAAVILGFFISRGLSSPIRELVRGTDRVSRGNYDFQINISSKDEFGILGKAFNSMVHGLLLKERYRNALDRAVSPEIAEEMLKGNLFLGGENRVVTTLFADIRGFTALTEGMDPKVIIVMLNDFLKGAGAAIEAEGGVVDKYVGDQVMAIFGAPLARADDAQRAVRAALRMQESMSLLNQDRSASGQPEMPIGIGINSGLVVAGNVGSGRRLNYTVLGEPVNIASRLCSMAKAGEILISTTTWEGAGPGLVAEALPPVSLKGLTNPVKVWLVKGMETS